MPSIHACAQTPCLIEECNSISPYQQPPQSPIQHLRLIFGTNSKDGMTATIHQTAGLSRAFSSATVLSVASDNGVLGRMEECREISSSAFPGVSPASVIAPPTSEMSIAGLFESAISMFEASVLVFLSKRSFRTSVAFRSASPSLRELSIIWFWETRATASILAW